MRSAKYTLVQDPDNKRALVVRRVPPEQLRMVARWRGYLFATEVDATRFAEKAWLFRRSARYQFSLRRFDGHRLFKKRRRRGVVTVYGDTRGFGFGDGFGDSGGFDGGGGDGGGGGW